MRHPDGTTNQSDAQPAIEARHPSGVIAPKTPIFDRRSRRRSVLSSERRRVGLVLGGGLRVEQAAQ